MVGSSGFSVSRKYLDRFVLYEQNIIPQQEWQQQKQQQQQQQQQQRKT